MDQNCHELSAFIQTDWIAGICNLDDRYILRCDCSWKQLQDTVASASHSLSGKINRVSLSNIRLSKAEKARIWVVSSFTERKYGQVRRKVQCQRYNSEVDQVHSFICCWWPERNDEHDGAKCLNNGEWKWRTANESEQINNINHLKGHINCWLHFPVKFFLWGWVLESECYRRKSLYFVSRFLNARFHS